jgi:DNA polymerase sigma
VKFKVLDSLNSKLECDLCINNVLACHNTELLLSFTMLDWRYQMLLTSARWHAFSLCPIRAA